MLATEQVSKHQNQARKILLVMSMVHQEMVKMNPPIKDVSGYIMVFFWVS